MRHAYRSICLSLLCLLAAGLLLNLAGAVADEPRPDAKVPHNLRDSTVPLTDRLSADQPTRILELIYVLRRYRVFERDDEMAYAVRELIKIGEPALPELIAELDHTDRDDTIRALGITLRGMKDYRAVHALIRAIPKTLRPAGSDCRIAIRDPELRTFMLTLERHPRSPTEKNPSVSMGRPVNEILGTLEKLTGYLPLQGDRDPLRHVFLGKPEQQADQRKQFQARQDEWRAWWATHHSQFLSEEANQQFRDPTPPAVTSADGLDAVERAGEARFGTPFPTGSGVQLGPVHNVELFNLSLVDAPCAIDFDQDRTYRIYEGAEATGGYPRDWDLKNGIDFTLGSDSGGMHVWTIDRNRWDTIEAEVQSSKRLDLGKETHLHILHAPEEDTFLFTTREGGMGVLRLEPYRPEKSSQVVRYRMWTTEPKAAAAIATVPTVEQPTGWGDVVTVQLPVVGAGTKSFWSIDKQGAVELTGDVSPESFLKQFHQRNGSTVLDEWRRKQLIHFFPKWSKYGSLGPPRPDDKPQKLELYYFDMQSEQVRPQAFDQLSAETAMKLLSESAGRSSPRSGAFYQARHDHQCHLFLTDEGHVGLLQIANTDEKTGVIEFRYKIASNR